MEMNVKNAQLILYATQQTFIFLKVCGGQLWIVIIIFNALVIINALGISNIKRETILTQIPIAIAR